MNGATVREVPSEVRTVEIEVPSRYGVHRVFHAAAAYLEASLAEGEALIAATHEYDVDGGALRLVLVLERPAEAVAETDRERPSRVPGSVGRRTGGRIRCP